MSAEHVQQPLQRVAAGLEVDLQAEDRELQRELLAAAGRVRGGHRHATGGGTEVAAGVTLGVAGHGAVGRLVVALLVFHVRHRGLSGVARADVRRCRWVWATARA
jgi:hypothetical protein